VLPNPHDENFYDPALSQRRQPDHRDGGFIDPGHELCQSL